MRCRSWLPLHQLLKHLLLGIACCDSSAAICSSSLVKPAGRRPGTTWSPGYSAKARLAQHVDLHCELDSTNAWCIDD